MPDSPNPVQPVVPVILDPTPPFYASKKFWVAVGTTIVTAVVTLLLKHGGATAQEIIPLVLPIISTASVYILGQSIVDSKVYPAIVNQSNNQPPAVSTDQPTK